MVPPTSSPTKAEWVATSEQIGKLVGILSAVELGKMGVVGGLKYGYSKLKGKGKKKADEVEEKEKDKVNEEENEGESLEEIEADAKKKAEDNKDQLEQDADEHLPSNDSPADIKDQVNKQKQADNESAAQKKAQEQENENSDAANDGSASSNAQKQKDEINNENGDGTNGDDVHGKGKKGDEDGEGGLIDDLAEVGRSVKDARTVSNVQDRLARLLNYLMEP